MAKTNKVIRWLFSSLGYLLYTVGVAVILLWVLFPIDTVKTWLQRRLNTDSPTLIWEIKGMEAVFPLQLELSDVRVLKKNQTK